MNSNIHSLAHVNNTLTLEQAITASLNDDDIFLPVDDKHVVYNGNKWGGDGMSTEGLNNLISTSIKDSNKVYLTTYSGGVYTISDFVDLTKYNKITVYFSSFNPVPNPQLKINGVDYPMKTNGKLLDYGQVQAQEVSDVWITGGEARLYGDDTDRASDSETLGLISDTTYMTPKRVGMVLDQHNTNASSHENIYQKSKAYTDANIKITENIPIYFNSNTLSFTRPTSTGSDVTIAANTTERVFYDKSLAIGRSGSVSPNNVYWLKLFFKSVSNSRITYMRVQYSVKGIELINEVNILNNTASDYEFGDFLVMNKLQQALDYTETDEIRIVLSFWVSTGTDTLYMFVGDRDNTSALIRLEPTTAAFATKEYVDQEISKLRNELLLLINK